MIASDIAKITGGRLYGSPGLPVTGLLTDSRQVTYTGGLAFVAIRGRNHDGHKFIPRLYGRGIKIFIAENLPEQMTGFTETAFILVKSSVKALQDIASYRRHQFRGMVIAVTGSAGKTVVKEWLADIMGSFTSVVRSPKSFNSQVGVPLSVWKLDEQYNTGIFEAGISQPGEMKRLRDIIDPDIGVITNIGDAHGENFSSPEEKASEKLVLFEKCRKIIYCMDYPVLDKLIRKEKKFSGKEIVSWSFQNKNAVFKVSRSEIPGGKTALKITSATAEYDLSVPFTDRASVENACTVAVTCLAVLVPDAVIRTGLATLTAVAMRMEIKSGINGCSLIEDYYNSDPGSLGMAIEYLVSKSGSRKALILSDFIQSGRDESELYGEVARLVSNAGIEKFIGIGEVIMRNGRLFPAGSRFYRTTGDFILHFPFREFSNETILLKGARIFEFEKIGMLLEKQVHQTLLEINLDNISHNLNTFRQHLNKGTRIMAMIKAFAYGAGPTEIALLLEYHGIDYLAVAFADEGVSLREAGVSLPVVVMNPEESAFGLMIKYNLEPELYSLSLLGKFGEAASRHGAFQFPVHIKIDSGMHRLGFMPEETDMLISEIRKSSSIKVASVFSHLAASEDPALDSFTRKQATLFESVSGRIRDSIGYSFLRHILNSAGIVRFPEFQFEMVRPGIGIYGVNGPDGLDLKPAGRYVTRISQLKLIPPGEPVGYGCTDVSGLERLIAILPVGYADGLDRKLGRQRGSFFIAGRRVPIIGNICMDMCMADVTGLEVSEGDEAEIFGRHIKVEEVAAWCDTIPYEVLTSIPSRVKRVFYRE